MLRLVLTLTILINIAKSEPIVNGNIVDKIEYPFLVLLKIVVFERDVSTNNIDVFRSKCGGTIVTPKTILTAAHCIEDGLTLPQVDVFAGFVNEKDLPNLRQTHMAKMEDYRTHPNFIDDDIDLALVYLRRALELTEGFVETASFTVAKIGYAVTVTGWGLEAFNQPVHALRKAIMKVISTDKCDPTFLKRENFVCVYHMKQLRTFCDGDSGGPVIYNGKVVAIILGNQPEEIVDKRGKTLTICSAKHPAITVRLSKQMGWIIRNKK